MNNGNLITRNSLQFISSDIHQSRAMIFFSINSCKKVVIANVSSKSGSQICKNLGFAKVAPAPNYLFGTEEYVIDSPLTTQKPSHPKQSS